MNYNEDTYRENKKTKPNIDEDSDHYGYNDTNAGPIMDNNFDPTSVFRLRKHNKSKVKVVRKQQKKCKCKKR